MISVKEYNQLQRILEGSKQFGVVKITGKEETPLVPKFAMCSDCNDTMTAYLNKSRNIHYYKCNSYHKTVNAETSKSSQNVGLNNQFKEVLDEFTFSDNLKDLFSAQLKKIIDNELSDFSEKKRLASMELNNLKKVIIKWNIVMRLMKFQKIFLTDRVKKSMTKLLKKQKNLIFYQQKNRTMKMLPNIF